MNKLFNMRNGTYKRKIDLHLYMECISGKIKAKTSHQNLSNFTNTWFGPSCKCCPCLFSEANKN